MAGQGLSPARPLSACVDVTALTPRFSPDAWCYADATPGIAGDVCSAQGDRAPDRASSGLRSIEDAAKSLRQELNKTR